MSFAMVSEHRRSRVEPPTAPESFGAFKKNEKSAGVLGLMDMLVKDLESNSKDMEFEEKTAQKDYAKLMKESMEARKTNAKAITNKEAAKADVEAKLDTAKANHRAVSEDVLMAKGYINDLHGSCDFLLENYDMRKDVRANEIESLKNA